MTNKLYFSKLKDGIIAKTINYVLSGNEAIDTRNIESIKSKGFKTVKDVVTGESGKFKNTIITYTEDTEFIYKNISYTDMTDEEVILAYPIQTQLDLYRSLEKLGQKEVLDNALATSPEFSKQWLYAQDIKLDDPVFRYALQQLGITDEFLVQIIKNIDVMILNGELEG